MTVRGSFTTVDVRLGECECPPLADGSVRHADGDVAVCKADRLDYGDIRRVSAAIGEDPGPRLGEGGLAQVVLIVRATRSWNLVGEDGEELPIDNDDPRSLLSVDGLSAEQAFALNKHVNRFAHYFIGKAAQAVPAAPPPPNPSGGPSPDGSAESEASASSTTASSETS